MGTWFVLRKLLVPCVVIAAACSTACNAPKPPSVQDLTHQEDLSDAKMMTLRGTRDGATLDTEAMFSGRALSLTLKMRFAIGTPTTLMSGTWVRVRPPLPTETGTLTARNVSFLGGQGGSPSIGGTFDLLDANGMHKYRVVVPLLELTQRLDPSRTQP
jgi:hypothetical protein